MIVHAIKDRFDAYMGCTGNSPLLDKIGGSGGIVINVEDEWVTTEDPWSPS